VPSQLAAWWRVSTDSVSLGPEEIDGVFVCFDRTQHNTLAFVLSLSGNKKPSNETPEQGKRPTEIFFTIVNQIGVNSIKRQKKIKDIKKGIPYHIPTRKSSDSSNTEQ
jgi:hypothetical protein